MKQHAQGNYPARNINKYLTKVNRKWNHLLCQNVFTFHDTILWSLGDAESESVSVEISGEDLKSWSRLGETFQVLSSFSFKFISI